MMNNLPGIAARPEVEAMAQRLHRANPGTPLLPWDRLWEMARNNYREMARAALGQPDESVPSSPEEDQTAQFVAECDAVEWEQEVRLLLARIAFEAWVGRNGGKAVSWKDLPLVRPDDHAGYLAVADRIMAAIPDIHASADLRFLVALVDARAAALAHAMPNELVALRVMSAAVDRLKALGFRDVTYCPKDGETREFIEAGSSGIHTGSRWRDGGFWLADVGDLWPSNPILFREPPSPTAKHSGGAA